jgi:hypothetical protein
MLQDDEHPQGADVMLRQRDFGGWSVLDASGAAAKMKDMAPSASVS